MADKPGLTKEQRVREMRETAAQATAAAPAPAEPMKENDVRTTAKRKGAAPPKVAKPTKQPRSAKKVDRSPQRVGEFIAAAGDAGVAMADIEKRFEMQAHPLRTKIFQARHELGFVIDYVGAMKRYVGKAPKAREAA